MSTTKSSAEFAALINKLSAFVENEVIPTEDLRISHDAHAIEESIQALRQRAVAQGLGNPRRPVSEGGLGLSWEECCSYLEQAGRSFLGPGALQCAAPGQPDIAALDKLANDSQRKRYLEPLMRGEKYSCFAMTEPAPGVGSDPRMLMTQANRSTDGWVIDGHKWFISGAMRADFAIVVARTEEGLGSFLIQAPEAEAIPTLDPTRKAARLDEGGKVALCRR
jgi:acyl-CoA dehydrogenase